MPRGRKKTTNPDVTPVSPETLAEASISQPVGSVDSSPGSIVPDLQDSFAAELGASDPATPLPGATAAATPMSRGRFRSWVVDATKGYTRLTDEQEHRLVLQFAQKPAGDVLTALKGAGFHYHPDYHGQKQAWVRRNDFEGRLQLEAIEKLIGTVPQREAAER